MRLSSLQKYILENCYLSKNGEISKNESSDFYAERRNKKMDKDIQDVLHRSIENLGVKNLVIVYGRKTAHKWFINKIRLTARGRRIAQELVVAKQRRLPIR